jgi:uncharacterized protein YgbK (DUF1537 family)
LALLLAAVVADDLTGAADTGAGFVRAGLRTVVTWYRDELDVDVPAGADVLAIDTGSRGAPAKHAAARTAQVTGALRARGVNTIFKKVDSTLRGHIGAEVAAALQAWHAGSIAVVAPAFPAAGRTTVGGRQHVGGAALPGPPIASMLAQAGLNTWLLDLAAVRSDELTDAMMSCLSGRVRAVVCDAETEDDLRRVVRAGLALPVNPLWVASGGLAPALAMTVARRNDTPPAEGPTNSEPGPLGGGADGPVLTVVGSASPVARAQAAQVIASGTAHVPVPVGESVVPGSAAEIERLLRSGMDVIVTLEGTTDGPGQPMIRIGELLASSAPLVGALVVTGGETATSVLRAWNTRGLRLAGEIEPGVPLSVSIAPRPIPVVTKAGSFGRPETLAFARTRLASIWSASR